MRRAKIRPSINLAASRRPVRASSTTSASSDRSLKSPAKNVPSSPAKTLPTAGAGSVTRSSRSSTSLSTPSKTEQSQPKVVQKQLETGSGGAGRVRRNSGVAQGKQTSTEREGQVSSKNMISDQGNQTETILFSLGCPVGKLGHKLLAQTCPK